MKLTLELSVEVDTRDPQTVESVTLSAFHALEWTLCNGGSRNEIRKLHERMASHHVHNASVHDSGSLGWVAGIRLEDDSI